MLLQAGKISVGHKVGHRKAGQRYETEIPVAGHRKAEW